MFYSKEHNLWYFTTLLISYYYNFENFDDIYVKLYGYYDPINKILVKTKEINLEPYQTRGGCKKDKDKYFDIEMTPTDFFQRSENINQKDDEKNFIIKYDDQELIFIMTTQTFNDKPIYKLFVPYYEGEIPMFHGKKSLFSKHIGENNFSKLGLNFSNYQKTTIRNEKDIIGL